MLLRTMWKTLIFVDVPPSIWPKFSLTLAGSARGTSTTRSVVGNADLETLNKINANLAAHAYERVISGSPVPWFSCQVRFLSYISRRYRQGTARAPSTIWTLRWEA